MKRQSNTVADTAGAFLAAGGRLLVSPSGRLESSIDAGLILLPAVRPQERAQRIEATKAVIAAERHHKRALRALVAQHGSIRNGWQVWEAGR